MSTVSWNTVRQTAKAGGTIPEDTYNLVLTDAKPYVSGKGNAGIRFTFKVEDGEWRGALVKHQPTINLEQPGMTANFLEDLEVMGVTEGFLVDDREMDEVAAFILSQPRRCRAATEVNDFGNQKTNKVKSFTSLQPAMGAGGGSFSITPPTVSAPPPFAAPAAPAVQSSSVPF